MEFEEERYRSQPGPSGQVVDKLLGRIAVGRDSVYYWQAKQPRWKHERPRRGAKVDNRRPCPLRSHTKLPDTVIVDPLAFMALQLPKSNHSGS